MLRRTLLLTLLCATTAQAGQLYRWTDAEGNVHYTDQPPPPEARAAERKRLGDKPPAPALPYQLRDAVTKFPVTLYVADNCGDACKRAQAYLSQRGVPYTEKDARDTEVQKTILTLTGGKIEVPLVTVGSGTTLRGFEEGAWGVAFDAAGYPRSSMLPQGMSAKQTAPKAPPANLAKGAETESKPASPADPPAEGQSAGSPQ